MRELITSLGRVGSNQLSSRVHLNDVIRCLWTPIAMTRSPMLCYKLIILITACLFCPPSDSGRCEVHSPSLGALLRLGLGQQQDAHHQLYPCHPGHGEGDQRGLGARAATAPPVATVRADSQTEPQHQLAVRSAVTVRERWGSLGSRARGQQRSIMSPRTTHTMHFRIITRVC